jgi:Uma2 family endonuclease
MALTKPTGRKTYDDLLRLPDDGRRYEIIEGVLYEMPSPGSDHAIAIINLIAVLLPVVTALRARLFTAPLDVFFPGADPVQPDLLVLLPDRLPLISKRGIEGAPDLVVEVLSPSNPEHDRITKRALYARGGVREYWLVSPEAATIEVLVLDGTAYRTHLRAGGDELVTSTVLAGLSFPTSSAFAPVASK